MNDIINKKTNRLHVDTFAAIQTVKYDLRAKKQTSISRFRRINFLRSPIDQKLCRRMRLSRKAYGEKIEALKTKRKKRNEEMGVVPVAKRQKVSVHREASTLKNKLLKK